MKLPCPAIILGAAMALSLSGATLYGTASTGDRGVAGTVSLLGLANQQSATLHSFPALAGSGTTAGGAFPVAPRLRVGVSPYGTTFDGGPGAPGTVFSLPVPAPLGKHLIAHGTPVPVTVLAS